MSVRPLRLALLLPLLLATLLLPGLARAGQPAGQPHVKIGILNDQNGPFADQSGKGSVAAAQLAIEEFSKEDASMDVKLVYEDHQNKPDLARQIVGAWLDRDGVTAVADVPNSGVGLAINDLIHSRNKTFLATNVGTSDLTGKFCQPTTVQWSFDTWAFGNSAAQAFKKGPFYFISFDYALGTVTVRPDGRAIHPMLVFRVKSPAESHRRWDDYAPVATIAARLFTSGCNRRRSPLVPGGIFRR